MRAVHRVLQAGVLLLIAVPALAQTVTRPAAPVVTVGTDLKQLVFDWDPVPGASVYRVLEKLQDGAPFNPIGERIPAGRTRAVVPVAVHLQNWDQSRYVVLACNAAGCTRSAEIAPTAQQMLDTIGYFKASNTGAGDRFGSVIAISSDGSRLAVSAEREDSAAAGVGGNQADNSSLNSGAVYVFRRDGRRWTQEAYLKAGVNQPQQSFGASLPLNQKTLALSEDGSVLAVGAPAHNSGALFNDGAVFVYTRSGTTWTLASTLRAPTSRTNDYFGTSVDLSLDGRTLKVTSLRPADAEGNHEGRIHIYERPESSWKLRVTLPPYYAGDRCVPSRLSGDGRTLVNACYTPLLDIAHAVTYKRRDTVWVFAADHRLDSYSPSMAMAITYHGDRAAFGQSITLQDNCRSMFVTIHDWNGTSWEAPSLHGGPRYNLPCSIADEIAGRARSLEFDKHGHFLAFPDYTAPSGGVGASPSIMSGTEAQGSIYLFERVLDDGGLPFWRMRTHVKAPNPGLEDHFGFAVALSGNGRIMAVGARKEDSAARGIDGNQSSQTAADSGAVYLY